MSGARPLAADSADPLALSQALTSRTLELCDGLEQGRAEILGRVTPVTAELLRWWFSEETTSSRRGARFHGGQRQAILNTVVAHEVVGCLSLRDLYDKIAPQALLSDGRLDTLARAEHAHPKYCLKMATGTGKTWVLQALMIWQLLNKNQAIAEDRDDPRFTRHFLVVAPGLIVYERLLDAFCGRTVSDGRFAPRDADTSDLVRNADLFIPERHREAVFAFVRGNVCPKPDIGLKATGNGMIAITNWHLLAEGGDSDPDAGPGPSRSRTPDPAAVVDGLLPLAPGRATGNSLDVLDRRHARGDVLAFLAGLGELMVFNDEAHHIHEFRREGDVAEVEWQRSLNRIAGRKGRRFAQVDFSATPYNEVGTARNRRKLYFPHVIADFDLRSAMRAGLVKSLVLDKRKEIGALPLEFRAERDADGNLFLGEGQRVMLRAGLHKLRKLEAEFARIDPRRPPKMLVVCEDTAVSPLVARFLRDEGVGEDDVMTIDSGKKAELGEKEWACVRQRLFDVDRRRTPRIIVSVLMLREGFDVDNICVIVPLRSSRASILLEQTIGRGLRLMWRDAEYADIKRENRARIDAGQEPDNLIDVLSIVEHPAFQQFYDDLVSEGLAASSDGGLDTGSGVGDMRPSALRDGYEPFDFAIPFILREVDELLAHAPLDIDSMPPFAAMDVARLKQLVGRGDQFISQDLQSSTLFGGYRIDGERMSVTGYNDYLSRITRRIGQALGDQSAKTNRIAARLANPHMPMNTAELAGWIDDYIATRLFGASFDPLADENWRLLTLEDVTRHIIKVFGAELREAETSIPQGRAEVRYRRISEVPQLMVRESCSIEVGKAIYRRLPFPARGGGLEKRFIQWAQADASVQAFCKISETRHDFVRMRYVREDGLCAFYSPDFLVRTGDAVYLVETKAQEQTLHPNVLRKQKAALAWCDRVNQLDDGLRDGRRWHYVLLGEDIVTEWHDRHEQLSRLLNFARLRAAPQAARQERLL